MCVYIYIYMDTYILENIHECVYIYIHMKIYMNVSVQFSHSVMSDSLRPHELHIYMKKYMNIYM